MTGKEVRERLVSLSEENYKNFSKKLIPNTENILGVRSPHLKRLAKEVAKVPDEYLSSVLLGYHEERIVFGLVINYAKIPINEKFVLLDKWLSVNDNWAINDLVLMGFKDFEKPQNKEAVFDYFTSKLGSCDEYVLRACIVVLFRYFLDSEHISEVIRIFALVKSDKYYVNMAIAWGVCEILIKDFDKGYNLLKSGNLDKFTHNKAIQKARESFRISPENKAKLQCLKR